MLRSKGAPIAVLAAMLAAAGCSLVLFEDPPGGTDARADGDGAPEGSDGDGADGDADGDVADDGDGEAGPGCGNGVPDEGEQCDDGAGNSDALPDACRTDCRLPWCGDGVEDTGEECDDDGSNSDERPDACRTDCRMAHCGDAVQDTGEECDRGADNSDERPDACRTSCLEAYCGDGVRDTGEACDDGNTDDTDDCRNNCSRAGCGDGVPGPDEQCDDGNTIDTDDCLTTCMLPSCGDGFVHAGAEDCDGSGSTLACTTDCGSTGTTNCTDDCRWSATCTPPIESCNGEDDDCASGCDNGYACCRGATSSEICGHCGHHERTCGSTCAWGSWTACTEEGPCGPGATETGPCGACGVQTRVCTGGCAWGDWGSCSGEGECVGGTMQTCPTSCGTTGTQECGASCTWGSCTPPAETCNGADDDCDSACDEGWTCCAGEATPCTSAGCEGTRTCSASCALGACVVTPPSNDTCSGSISWIPSGGGTVTGTICGATNGGSGSCGGAGGADVLYRLRVAARSLVVIAATGASFSPVVYVRSGSACPGSSEAACRDTADGTGSPLKATLSVGDYWIVVDSPAASSTGAFALDVTVTPSPPNDNCAGAIGLTSGTPYSGDTGAADNDNTSACAATSGPDVWYTFTLAGDNTVVYADTLDGQPWDSVLEIRSGDCAAPTSLTCVDDACMTARSQLVTKLNRGTYYLVVDGYNATSAGPFTLRFQTAAAAACGRAATVSLGPPPTILAGTVNAAELSYLSPGPTCMAASSGPEALFAFGSCTRPGVTTSPHASLCDPGMAPFDPVLYVRAGSCTAADVACNDDGSGSGCSGGRSDLTATLGAGLHFIVVDTKAAGAGGAFSLFMDGYM